jgi:hypothetical protein
MILAKIFWKKLFLRNPALARYGGLKSVTSASQKMENSKIAV